MTDDKINVRLSIEAVDADTLADATVTRLVVEGPSETVEALTAVVLLAAGGSEVVTKATTFKDGEEERDVTAVFKNGPTRLDSLYTGDESV
jgi:hypothetical protein